MSTIYDQAKDKNVANHVFYGKTSDSKLYYSEAEDAAQVTQEDLTDAFLKGRALIKVIADETEKYYAVVNVIGNTASTIGLVSTTVTITEWTAKAAV